MVIGGSPLNPISGAAVTLFAAGNSYGSGATQLATTTSDMNGNFSLPYSCPNPSSTQTYIVALGGNDSGTANGAIGLMALTGPCANLGTLTSVTVDELTTVAAQWALAQFTDSTGRTAGAPSTNTIGLANAASLAMSNLADSATGNASAFLPASAACAGMTPPANCATLKQIDTIANLLAACIESSGSGSAACTTLLADAGGASDTLAAAHTIATHPAANVANLFTLQGPSASAPFQPNLASAPGDFTVSLNYTGGGLNHPALIAIDAEGDAWIANANANEISELSPVGSDLTGGLGYSGGGVSDSFGIAIDSNSLVWLTNTSNASISEFCGATTANCPTGKQTTGQAISGGAGYTGGGLSSPRGIAIDINDLVWVANESGNSLSEFCGSSTGNCPTGMQTAGHAISGPAGYTGGGLSSPIGVASDSNGLIWAADFTDISLTCGSNTAVCGGHTTGQPITSSSGFTGGGVLSGAPLGIAIDNNNLVWIANTTNTASEFCGSVTATCPMGSQVTGDALSGSSGFTGGGLSGSLGWIAVDSAGNAFVPGNQSASFLAELSASGSALSPAGGFQGAGLNGGGLATNPPGIAIDSAGNIWISNNGTSGSGANSITEFVGLASPVKTPLIGAASLP